MDIRNIMNLVESAVDYSTRIDEAVGFDPLGIVAQIRTLDNEMNREYTERLNQAQERESPFHLSPCGRCHSPVWQQPCPVCNFYPYGDRDDGVRMNSPEWQAKAQEMRDAAHEKYRKIISQYGNIAAWFFADKRNNSLYNIGTGKTTVGGSVRGSWNTTPIPEDARLFVELVEEYIKKAQSMSFPDADTIWEAYNHDNWKVHDDNRKAQNDAELVSLGRDWGG